MPESAVRIGPLPGAPELAVAGIGLQVPYAHINLRGDGAEPRFRDALRSVTGMEPPLEANSLLRSGGLQLAWLGPDEWLLSTPADARAALLLALETALAGLHAGATDISDAYTVFELDCVDAGEILAAECPLDLHERTFPVGRCAQSLVGKAQALIVREAPQRFSLYVRRSFAAYVQRLLCHAATLDRAARELPQAAIGGSR